MQPDVAPALFCGRLLGSPARRDDNTKSDAAGRPTSSDGIALARSKQNRGVTTSTRPPIKPLRELLECAAPSKVSAVRAKLAGDATSDLIANFQARFRTKRLAALLIAEQLAARGVPPVFWHDPRSTGAFTPTQEFDLLTYDVRYLQPIYWRSPWPVRVNAFSAMLSGRQPEAQFHKTVEWIWNGDKPSWWAKGRLAIPVERQAACMYLGKQMVLKEREQLALKRDRVYKAITDDVAGSRTTVAYGAEERKETLKRRMSLWWIAELTAWGPSDVAAAYNLLTDAQISRQAVAKQLDIIQAVLADAGIGRAKKKRLNIRP